ncbi:hypothetical protein PENTCL1PPCAC_3156, partial [Pristionchus entomophagus]
PLINEERTIISLSIHSDSFRVCLSPLCTLFRWRELASRRIDHFSKHPRNHPDWRNIFDTVDTVLSGLKRNNTNTA